MKYYKITNQEEKHNNLQYKDGLNTDILPFNPSGNCEPGGIYFAKEDILAFLDYGPWIREVIIPEGEEIYENPGTPKKYKAHQVFLGPRKKIDLKVIKELVEEGVNIHAENDEALINASSKGYLEVVKFLVEKGANIHADKDYALIQASYCGHLEVVKYLVEKGVDIHADNDYALIQASYCGHLEIADYLKSLK